MKTNKSILLLLTSFLFVFASCSQARYGSMMRKAKPQQKDHKEVRIAKSSVESVSPVEEMVHQPEIETTVSQLEPSLEIQEVRADKTAKTLKPQQERIDQVVKLSEKIPATPLVKRAKKKVINHIEQVQESNDDRSLIRLLIIIILLLIVLNLILDLIHPAFTGILGLIFLILIFLWLLNYL